MTQARSATPARCLLTILFFLLTPFLHAAPAKTVPALLVSDIHFDPFADPARVPELARAPLSDWNAILASPSPDHLKDYTALLTVCSLRGADTGGPLWLSSLEAMKSQGAGLSFVTVSGDFLAHSFICKFNKSFPAAKDADLLAFIEKTIRYVVEGMHTALPNIPIYFALGNNDSGCGDYEDEAKSPFLAATARILAETIPKPDRQNRIRDVTSQGFYSASLPAEVPNTRILVLNGLFLSSRYRNCEEKLDPNVTDRQIAWLRSQLADARAHHRNVWILSHIAPGVDLYATLTKMRNICGKTPPQMFLANDRLNDLLAANADIIRLAVFGHSHTDELRLLTNESPPARPGPGLAVKIVTSISPVNGNKPAFTVAQVDPATANLVDYTVVQASNLTGIATTWSKEYTFSEAYHQPSFTPGPLKTLTDAFRADPTGSTPESSAYLKNFYVGDRSALIKPLWPEYVCALTHNTAQTFTDCVCKR